MSYDFEIIYFPGKLNIVANMLSWWSYVVTIADNENQARDGLKEQIWVAPKERAQLIQRIHHTKSGNLQ